MMITAAALTCLSLNVFYEARGENVMGQVAVAMVTINRANATPHTTICKVVYAPHQFSWTATTQKPPTGLAWKTSQAVAKMSLKLNPADFGLEDILYFHNTSVSPKWSTKLHKVTQIGNHIFYKET